MPEYPDDQPTLEQFNRLIDELLEPGTHRSKFRPWEIQVLLDIESCDLPGTAKRDRILRQYQQAVQRQMQRGATGPFKLSEYLESTQPKPPAKERSATIARSKKGSQEAG